MAMSTETKRKFFFNLRFPFFIINLFLIFFFGDEQKDDWYFRKLCSKGGLLKLEKKLLYISFPH